MSWLGRLFGRKKAEAPKEAPHKYSWQDKKYGFTWYEMLVLCKLEEINKKSADGENKIFWCGGAPSNGVVKCPYCGGPIIELYKQNGGFVLNVSNGLFCLRCGTELVCAVKGCRYKSGDNLVGERAHWGCDGAQHHQYKIRRGGRNLHDIITAKLEEQRGLEAKPADEPPKLPEPDFQDEYTKLDARLDEIAAEKVELEEEDIRIRERMKEINRVFAAEALELAEPPKELAAAADGDIEIIAEAEEEAARLTPAADEGDK